MAGTQANNLTNPAVSASGELDNLLLERFTGMVREATIKREQFIDHFRVQDVVGTNQVTNKNMGDTELQTLVAGQEPESHSVQFDNHSLVVDTVVLARNTIAMLHMLQSDIQVQQRMASNHAKKLIMLNDETLLTQVIKGALTDEEEGGSGGRVSGHEGGSLVRLGAVGDEKDPVKFLRAIEFVTQKMNEKEVENDDMVMACPWEQFYVLADNDKLTRQEYTVGVGVGNGDSKVNGYVMKAMGFPVRPTNRIRQVAHNTAGGEHHQLSNVSNGFRYDTLAGDANCVAVFFTSDALLIGRTMGLESDIFFNKRLKTNFVDSWYSFGAIADDLSVCGAIFAHADYVPRKKFKEANPKHLMVD